MGYLPAALSGRSPYRAPEMRLGGNASFKVDQFALAAIVRHVLRVTDQSGAVEMAPEIARATAVDPLHRYPTMEAFRTALAQGFSRAKKRRGR